MADTDDELASSSSSSSKSWNHDVFLSFDRIFTRNGFVDRLYKALGRQAINTCMLDPELAKYQHFEYKYALTDALKESRIAIIVFSQNYADSPMFLDEIAQIMENNMHTRGQIVMPIYHDVDPSELPAEEGIFGRVTNRYINKESRWHTQKKREDVAPWRKALVAAGNLTGWIISNGNRGQEARCIEYVVAAVSNTLFPMKDVIVVEGVEHLKIPLQTLKSATNNFSKDYLIARGGFGDVYKAQYGKGVVAIKLNIRRGQGQAEFMREIALLSAYKHKNLVSLVGFCNQGGENILVYQYESNGSLDKQLHRKDIMWIQRLQICLDAAHGLKYLHDDIGRQHRILHRDIKSSNILLDENFRAKISDFGLSKIALANAPLTLVVTGACGTGGYIDPEYFKQGILTQKSDVYSFGMVMFEVLCGKLVGVSKHLDVPFSAELAKNHFEKETLDEIIDPDLRNQMNSASLTTFSTIANQCLQSLGQERPRMSMIVKELEKALDQQLHTPG